jgi:tRNA (cmo5U34)-methyltransferase
MIGGINKKEQPEEMGDFFDQRAAGYDAHMAENLADAEAYDQSLAKPIPSTNSRLNILDLGCGTGLEIPAILEKAPLAQLTYVDLLHAMVARLKEKYGGDADLNWVQESYLIIHLGWHFFDIILSSMTLHHLLPEEKARLYPRIFRTLKPEGLYIEGDDMVSEEKIQWLLKAYETHLEAVKGGSHHIDIPLSIETQTSLLEKADFPPPDLIYQIGENVILKSQRPA